MLLGCCVKSVCCGADIEKIKSAGADAGRLAKETSDLCIGAREKSCTLIEFGRDARSVFSGFSNNGNGVDASMLSQIKNLVAGDRMKESVALAGEMDDVALECVEKSKEMTAAVTRGVDTLPDMVKADIEDEDTYCDGSESDDDEIPDLSEVDKDVEELEKCTEGIKTMNPFTAVDAGQNAFNGVLNKGEVCRTMFGHIQKFAESLKSIVEAFLVENTCSKICALAREARNMLRCIRLSSLIQKFAEAARRMIKAIINLLKVAWDKFVHLFPHVPEKIQQAAEKVSDKIEGVVEHVSDAIEDKTSALCCQEARRPDGFQAENVMLCCGAGS